INATIHTTLQNNRHYEQIPGLQAEYNRLLTSARLLQDSLQQRFSAISQTTAALSLEKLQSKTNENKETIISYFVGNSSVYQLMISNNQSEFNRLFKHKTEVSNFKNQV